MSEQSIDLLAAHDKRVADINWKYRWRMIDLQEMMSQAVRDRDAAEKDSWQQYLDEKTALVEDVVASE